MRYDKNQKSPYNKIRKKSFSNRKFNKNRSDQVIQKEGKKMGSHFVIDGNAFYEVDEECMRQKEEKKEHQKEKQKKEEIEKDRKKKKI